MRKAELKWNVTKHPTNPAFDFRTFSPNDTITHLVEVINEMQEEIKKLTNKKEV